MTNERGRRNRMRESASKRERERRNYIKDREETEESNEIEREK